MNNQGTNVAYMKKYLKYAFEFEKYIYLWENAMNSANNKLRSVQQVQKQANSECVDAALNLANLEDDFSNLEKQNNEKIKKYRKRAILVPVISILAVIIFSLFVGLSTDDFINFIAAIIVIIPAVGTPLLIASVYFIAKYFSFKNSNSKTNLEMKKGKTVDFERQRQNQNYLKSQQMKLREQSIKKDQQEIFNNLKKAKQDLNNIYSMNVLPVKYRNLVAVATMYEYLATGRCTQITGHGGIYDTYEFEKQNNTIISELRQIKNINNQILNNQQILISEVRQANGMLRNIEAGIGRIETINEQIATNTAISAAANTQTAASTRYMADLMYVNYV